MIDNRTVYRNYPLPDSKNRLKEDAARIKDAFEQADSDINDLVTTTDNLNTTTAGLTTQINDLSANISLGSFWQAVSTGNRNTYEVVLNPAPSNLSLGLFVHMKAHVQNTGPSTLNVNSLGAQTIIKIDGNELKAGDIPANALVTLIYDGANFQLLNPKSSNEEVENIKSNLYRAFEEIQENHGGSLLMESGWSDSFSNPDEQGADWETISMTQQSLPLSGDIRILRGTANIENQASGQDLLCRYQTEQGKDQFIHSWRLQAKS